MSDEPIKPTEPVVPSGGSVDFSTQPKEVQDLFNKLLEDKRQANAEAQKTKEKLKAIADEKEKADRSKLEEDQQWKTAYEKEKTTREKVEKETIPSLLREIVGLKAGLPEALITRLQGTTLEELMADAETLKAAIPAPSQKPPPSGTQNNTTSVPRGTPSGKTDEQIKAWLENKDATRSSSEPRQDGDVLVFGG
jgi:ribosomal protein L12E/L44/L45/RPP1/RPP2